MNLIPLTILWTMIVLQAVCRREEVIYAEVGRFSLKAPWTGLTRRLPAPQSPAKIKLQFYLMTRNTADKSSIEEWRILTTDFYKPTLDSLNSLDYQSDRKRTAVHVNGMYFTEAWSWILQKRLAMAYLHKEDANVILVKWDGKILRRRNFYPQLVANIRVVGAIAARFIEQLMELTRLNAGQIHLIGLSMGAHVAAYIGERLPNVHRITGLDPAKPLFENADPMYRLDRTDAEHVDVLHTHTVQFIPFGGLGVKRSIGDVDFFFNNGCVQPGCITNHTGDVLRNNVVHLKAGISAAYNMLTCSHLRAVDYWVESLENSRCTMWGTATKSQRRTGYSQQQYAPVGRDTFNFVTSGKYSVSTNGKSPFCIPFSGKDKS